MLFYEADHWILLFPTKQNWRDPSRQEYIEAGLEKFVSVYAEKQITSVAFPRLGCGNGALDWEEVRPIMERYLKNLPISVFIYLGPNTSALPEHQEAKRTIKWLRENAKDMSYMGVCDDLSHVAGLVPYEFLHGGCLYSVQYTDRKLQFYSEYESAVCTVENEQLYGTWYRLSTLGVVDLTQASPEEQMVYSLLHSLNYLTAIKIYNPNLKQMVDGYQLNAGLGRAQILQDT